MNNLETFEYEDKKVRTVVKDNTVWFVAKDVCDLFGETNRNRTMQKLDDDEKGYTQMTTPGGKQEIAIVNESGLYSLLFAMQPSKARSANDEYVTKRIEKLKQFKRWVTHEVLPSIKKHGAYITDVKIEEILLNPDTIIKLATDLKKEKEEKLQLQQKLEEAQPKVKFADCIMESEGCILVSDMAKILKQNGVETGGIRFFEWLRENGYLCKKEGEMWNMPTQYSMERGLFWIKEDKVYTPNGFFKEKTPMITSKGQSYFINKLVGKIIHQESLGI